MLAQIKLELEQLKLANQLKEFHARLSKRNGTIEIKGKKLLDFSNWDVLSLNENKKFLRSAHSEIENSGLGSASARLSTGTTLAHLNCEKRLAQFFGEQSALLFSSKNQATFSLLTAIVNEADIVFFDEHIQSPVADACYLVNANCVAFNSSNLSSLEVELLKFKQVRNRFIIIESVSGLSGKKIDLENLVSIAQKFDAQIILDESFALISQGLRGSGLREQLKDKSNILCVYSSLSHLIPCFGAVVAGSALLISYLIQRSKTLIHESSLPPAICAAIENALDIVELSQSEKLKLASNALHLRQVLSEDGFLDAIQSDSPIIGIMLGSSSMCKELVNLLYLKGYYLESVSLKTQITDVGLLRIIVSVMHTHEQLDGFRVTLAEVLEKIGEG